MPRSASCWLSSSIRSAPSDVHSTPAECRGAGLDKFLFGQAATLLGRDVITMALLGGAAVAAVALFWKEFKLLSSTRSLRAATAFLSGGSISC